VLKIRVKMLVREILVSNHNDNFYLYLPSLTMLSMNTIKVDLLSLKGKMTVARMIFKSVLLAGALVRETM
jgi:hypothetical protein